MWRGQKIGCLSTLNQDRRGAKVGLNKLVYIKTYLISSLEIVHALMSVAFYVSKMAQRVVWKPVALAKEKTRSEWRRRAEIHRTILTSKILDVLACRKVFPTIGRQEALWVVMRQPKTGFRLSKIDVETTYKEQTCET